MLQYAMEHLGLKYIKTPLHTFRIQKNGGKQALDIMVPAEELPEKYRIVETTVKPDKNLLREDLETGEAVPGVVLMEREESLRIR
jgi:hypothetical protein